MTNPQHLTQAHLGWQIPPLPAKPPTEALQEIIEWHEATGETASYYAEVAPAMEDEEQSANTVANLLIVTTGTPHQLATIKAILRSVL